ncbi:hypothetical protein LRD69_28645 [Streptomyces sp. JH14]|uniref:hypothetical protein n=1 Tax=Streptomyces sp. JH14 TaxID=2793630 RepID=UPI0023F7AFC0|nr:hypothetical protein [Streptomyces sp. JH14]MDF6046024.1 hypothetical protein [Streptomyces sp. JH14]
MPTGSATDGVATFVMRGKQYLTALRAEDKLLVLQTLPEALVDAPNGKPGLMSGTRSGT